MAGLLAGAILLLTLSVPRDDVRAEGSPAEEVVVTAAVRANARSVDLDEVAVPSTLTVADALNENIPSAYLSDTESNPLQPDLYYRGFDASPVLGSAEGLAVYQNGDRINEAFGDTVLWDMVPLFAVSRIDVVPGSDPVLGLNALGGAVSMNMKTAFDTEGDQVDISAGSFGRAKLSVQSSHQWGDEGLYAGAMAMHDDGWRRSSPSNLFEAYGDFSERASRGSMSASVTFATDKLSENAAVPVQDNPEGAFAIPDSAENRLVFIQGKGVYDFSHGFTFRGNAYFRDTHIESLNGQPSGFVPCAGNPLQLCNDGTPLVSLAGAPVPASAIGSGTLGVQRTETMEVGATAQIDWAGKILSLDDTAVFGVTLDNAPSDFESATELAVLAFEPGNVTSMTPDGTLLGGTSWNIRLRTINTDVGVFGEETLQVTPAVSIRVASRWNLDRIDLTDRYGTALSGNHEFSGFNPSAKVTWKATDGISLYADFGESSRTPTAAELSCASASMPCLFPLSFVSDPGLREVVARTFEVGAGGKGSWGELTFTWLADMYDTRNDHDIFFISSGHFLGSGYFSNVGDTERRGAELGLHASWRDWDASINYGFVDATFRSAFTEQSPFNPGADANGNIFVRRGNELPNIPRNGVKLSVGWLATPRLHLALQVVSTSGQYLRGDEANLQAQLSGYSVFNLDVDYRITDIVTLSIEAQNIFDSRYATFGLYGDPKGLGTYPQFTDPRFIVPAQPFGLWGGIKASW